MKLKSILCQHRRDFKAVFECEGCGATEEQWGYDDRNFHDAVIPEMKCKNCGRSRNDLGLVGERTETRYPEGMQV